MARTSSSGSEYKTIRARLTRVGLVPSVILLVLWLGFSSLTIYDGFYAVMVARGVQQASLPAGRSLVELQAERRMALERFSRPGSDPGAMAAQRARTDEALAETRPNFDGLIDDSPQAIAGQVRTLDGLLAELPERRAGMDSGAISRQETFDYYNRLLDAWADLFDTQARIVPDLAASHAGLAGSEVVRAADQMSQAASLGSAALAGGGFGDIDHVAFAHLVGSYHARLDTNLPVMEPNGGALLRQLIRSEAWRKLVAFENELIERPPQPGVTPVDPVEWGQVTAEVSEKLIEVAQQQAREGVELGLDNGNSRLLEVLAISLVGLLVVLVSIVLAARVARGLVDRTLVSRLASLSDDTLRLAHERLPDIMARLERGEQVDVEAELAPLDYGTDEIGQVADAFNTAHHTAVAAAVQENHAKAGFNKVFLGIAHRNQGLVHRQLKVLDRMERNEEHPERLAGLFELDHLATRARRNAENLVVLAGVQAGRKWRKPVRLADVVRAAIAETEHFDRIQVHRTPDLSVVGAAVGDVIHLLAELMDNATSFSAPESRVQVYCGDTTRGGVLVRIEDEGMGMRPAERDEANVLLASKPKFEDITLRGDSRLGLFVVAVLASRRGIKVELREASGEGTVAYVRLPANIVAHDRLFEDRSEEPDLLRLPSSSTAERSPGSSDDRVRPKWKGRERPGD
ncbi:Signal transduction histidine kinase [Saccharopolyspora antimicrobica]|uniref:histidine kinase n=1 Tax=Saccharopolyspora antimicrobica TaxID=455193 RepID=A0A1I4VJ97_9PSEU|nr:nitrate- and nitrite sensing domain-containing protein [Saccharopolyspora antimicrobica]RKT86336.1 signal transduction histidine kinase [Saccharopolyspora antimicrobica]SFN01170.1 Signal transduction histidine kinase [Saccharopolyspora antimicrobica]